MRNALPVFNEIAKQFSEQCNFVMVYLMEAHAADEWPLGTKVVVNQHKTVQERIEAAKQLQKKYSVTMPVVVDDIDNPFHEAYAAWPERYYIVDAESKLASIAVPGTLGYTSEHVEDVRQWLVTKFPRK